MKLNLSWAELAKACGGKLLCGPPEAPIDSISTDTRSLKAGQAFWALQGLNFDGHDFLAAARRADGWIVEAGRPLPAERPPHIVEVAHTLKALHVLAAHHRRRFDIPIAAVAGSNGKTTTKEMLRSICAAKGPVCASEGNLNNQFGLPFSILELGPEHRFGVFELGESHPGDIEVLTRILQPTVGVLTNVGPAHLEFFGDLKGVFQCLSELIQAAPPECRIAFNQDDPWLSSLESSLGARAIPYGKGERAMVRLFEEEWDAATLLIEKRVVPIRLPVPGRIFRIAAAAAAAGAVGMGLGPDVIAAGLEAFRPAPMRFEIRKHSSGASFVVDAYNANPASMRAGIESFCETYPTQKRILVLGDMKELGKESAHYHNELVHWAATLPVDAVFLAGPDISRSAQDLNGKNPKIEIHHGDAPSVWIESLRKKLGPGVAVFFKASRAMQFERIVEGL